jgi:cytochrome c-type biogenesis protein CcmH/NrfF
MKRRNDGTSECGRREFLSSVAAGLLSVVPAVRHSVAVQDSLPGTGPSGRLADPARAGRNLLPVVAADNDAAIQAIEKQIHCTCGCNQDVYTCRTTDFTCTTSPAMHRRVVALAEQGKTGQQILDEFVRENGVAILMAPPKRGLALLGYLVPPLVFVVAVAALTLVLLRWVRRPVPGDAATSQRAHTAAAPEELERLRRELDRLSL